MIFAGTGHRPDKLGGHSKQASILARNFVWTVVEIYKPHITRIISGGALGFDTHLAAAALAHKIPYSLYLPFEGFDVKWWGDNRKKLRYLCEHADEVKYVCLPGYQAFKMQIRNKAMVDSCQQLFTLYDGWSKGGTHNCVKYARQQGKPLVPLWDAWLDYQRTGTCDFPSLGPIHV